MIYLVIVLEIALIGAVVSLHWYISRMFEEITKWCTGLSTRMLDLRKQIGEVAQRVDHAETVAGNARARVADLERKIDRSVVYEAGH